MFIKPKQTFPLLLLFIYAIITGLGACEKDHGDADELKEDPGTITASLDGVAWTPRLHSASYSYKWQQLYLFVEGDGKKLIMGIQLDSNNLTRQYVIQPNGSNVAEMLNNGQPFASDYNVAGAGGYFNLTAFDTTQKKLSGQLFVTLYTGDRKQKTELAITNITDIPLVNDSISYNGSHMSCTVTGAGASFWEAKDMEASVNCIADGKHQQLELTFLSPLDKTRFLTIYVPLENAGLAQTVYPREPPHLYCGSRSITAKYLVRNTNFYFSNSGRFTITKLDTLNRKLDASFNMVLTDTAGTHEQITISNGKIHVPFWYTPGR